MQMMMMVMMTRMIRAEIRSFQHHGKRDATSSWTVFEILLLPDPDALRFGSVRWNDALLIDISFVRVFAEKTRTVNASAVRESVCRLSSV